MARVSFTLSALASLAWVLSFCATLVAGQEGPYSIPPGWEDDRLLLPHGNPNRRSDFCERQKLVSRGELALRDAIAGMNISVMVNLMEWGPFDGTFGICPGADQKQPGCVFHGAVMEELSQRASFSYKNTWTYGDSVLAENYKKWMMWVAANYDVGIGVATETADRLADGLVWNAYLTDNSFVLVTRKLIETKPMIVTLFQFLTPFSWEVWLMIVLGGFASSVLYVVVERKVNFKDLPEGTWIGQIGDAFMLACFQFTQAGSFNPKTAAGRGIAFTWSFTALLCVSAYTANLASFLISKEKSGFTITTIDEANAAGARVCHRKGWAIEFYLASKYPRILRVPVESQNEMWEFLRDGKCIAEAGFISTYKTEAPKMGYNPVCEMSMTPALPFSAQSGGWYSKSDSGVLCTGLLKDVFQLHISEMVADGRIEKYFDDFVAVSAATDPRGFACNEEADELDSARITEQLSLFNMGGIFIVHAILTLVALLTILEMCVWKKTKKITDRRKLALSGDQGDDNEQSVSETPSKSDYLTSMSGSRAFFSSRNLLTGASSRKLDGSGSPLRTTSSASGLEGGRNPRGMAQKCVGCIEQRARMDAMEEDAALRHAELLRQNQEMKSMLAEMMGILDLHHQPQLHQPLFAQHPHPAPSSQNALGLAAQLAEDKCRHATAEAADPAPLAQLHACPPPPLPPAAAFLVTEVNGSLPVTAPCSAASDSELPAVRSSPGPIAPCTLLLEPGAQAVQHWHAQPVSPFAAAASISTHPGYMTVVASDVAANGAAQS